MKKIITLLHFVDKLGQFAGTLMAAHQAYLALWPQKKKKELPPHDDDE